MAWDRPESDGGSPITGYYIERKERNSLLWVKANDTVVRTTEYPCAGLIEGLEYTFRVSAINRAGQGKPSKKTDFVTARTPIGGFPINTNFEAIHFRDTLSSKSLCCRYPWQTRGPGHDQELRNSCLGPAQERRWQ